MPSPENLSSLAAALRLIDREVWVITGANADRRGGLVATWVSTASIDPARPVLLIALAPNHFTAELVQESRAFAAHLLRCDQALVAWNFARQSGRSGNKLAGLECSSGVTGAPILADCLASFECRVFARFDAGDRLFFWGDVVDGQSSELADAGQTALREQTFIQALTAEQRQVLAADRAADARQNRPLHDQWRSTNPW